MTPRIIAVRIRRGTYVFHVHGEHAGEEGVWLAQGQVEGIYDTPVKTTWKSSAFMDGSRQKHHKREHRDLQLGFHLTETIRDRYEFNESVFRQVFEYEIDPWDQYATTTIEIETELSGVRKLDVLMYEQPEFVAKQDPLAQQYGNLLMKLRAGQPSFYQDDIVSTFTATTTSGSGSVTVENPTDQISYQKWLLTRGTWTLPDYQWTGPPGARIPGGDQGDRLISGITVTADNGGMVIDLDGQELMYRDATDTNAIAQQGGTRIFTFPIPPHTPPTDLPVSYTGAPTGGAMCQLVQPRRWSRPWGMEAVTSVAPEIPKTLTTRFSSVGDYMYTIPAWADAVDMVLIGGGGGGGGGWLLTGVGGGKGAWVTETFVRGTDIDADLATITGVIGAGGQGGPPWYALSGFDGSPTTAQVGTITYTANGGDGSSNNTVWGEGAGDMVFNGADYPGSQTEYQPGNRGNTPGGGGAGGWSFSEGGAGARGQVWFRAYTVEAGS